MPAVMLLMVIGASLVVLCLLAVVLWLSLTNGSPGDPDLTYTAQNFVEVFSDPRTFTVLLDTFDFSFVSLVVALAFGIPAAWLAERTDFPAKTLLFTLMAVGLLIPGFAAAMGWLFLLHPRIGLLNQLLMSSFHLAGAAAQHQHGRRHGLGAGAEPRAARLHHDGGGVPLHGPDARGSRADARRRRHHGPAPDHRAARLARHPRRRHLHLHDRLRGLRRAGDHRLGQPHLHLHHLSVSAAQSAGFAAALRARRGAQHRRHGARGADELVVRRHAAPLAPLRRGHRTAYRPRIVRLGRRRLAAWGFVGLYLMLGKVLPIALLGWSSLLPFFQLPSGRAFATDLARSLFLVALGAGADRAVEHVRPGGSDALADARAQPGVLLDRAALAAIPAAPASISSPSCRTRCPSSSSASAPCS